MIIKLLYVLAKSKSYFTLVNRQFIKLFLFFASEFTKFKHPNSLQIPIPKKTHQNQKPIMARNQMQFNSGYLSTHRGIIKILQVIFGFITCSLLCANWYGGRSCFYEGRIGFSSGLNFVIVIINIVLFILNLLNASIYSMERIYSVIGLVLFVIAFALMLWFIIEYDWTYNQHIAATVFIGLQMGLFIWDYQILHGQAYN